MNLLKCFSIIENKLFLLPLIRNVFKNVMVICCVISFSGSLQAQSRFVLHVTLDGFDHKSSPSYIVVSGNSRFLVKQLTDTCFDILLDSIVSFPGLVGVSVYPNLSDDKFSELQLDGRARSKSIGRSVFVADSISYVVVHNDSVKVVKAGLFHRKHEHVQNEIAKRIDAFNRQVGDRMHQLYNASSSTMFKDSVVRVFDSLFYIAAGRPNLDSTLMPAILENANNPVGLWAMDYYIVTARCLRQDIPFRQFKDILQAMPELQKHSDAWRLLYTFSEKLVPGGVAIGKYAPEFIELKDTSGRTVLLSEVKGKVVFVDFWASWCTPCVEQMPEFKKAYQHLQSENVAFIGVSIDENAGSWKRAIKRSGLQWINISDGNGVRGQTAAIYDILTVPHNFLINKDGVVVARDLPENKVEEEIRKLL